VFGSFPPHLSEGVEYRRQKQQNTQNHLGAGGARKRKEGEVKRENQKGPEIRTQAKAQFACRLSGQKT